jgi:hypothetical protein
MGIDKSLSDDYPSVIVNGRKYHYGREPHHGQYLVENATYAKDYWCFDQKEDLQAFLINLPESADHRRRIGEAYPDWHEATPDQRTAYLTEDRARQRAIAQEKVNNGTAQSFDMDFDGQAGPHPPQQIRTDSREEPLARVGRQLRFHHGHGMSGLSHAGRLRMIEGEIDWNGVDATHKEAVLSREIDFAKITPEQFRYVYQDIAFEKLEPADPTVAQALFDRAHAQPDSPNIRPATRDLINAVLLDVWPSHTAVVDFGLDSQKHLEALYYPLRHGDITPEQVDASLGNGPQLTALARSSPSNPHKDIEFRTSWDDLGPQPESDATMAPASQASPAELVERAQSPAAVQPARHTPKPKP